MEEKTPRVVIAGTNSGCGKTTVTCAVLQALLDRGLNVGAFKCGPDYIDPMFHSRVIGAESSNLDPFFFSENVMRRLLAKNAKGRDVSVIEGVMGFYDGLDMRSAAGSTYEVSQTTESPAVLVVGARGAALSALAVVKGFLELFPGNRIGGVIFNRCTAATYDILKEGVRERFGGRIEPLGFLPEMPDCSLESRHLGLVTAMEVKDLREKLRTLSRQAERSLDLDGLLRLARSAPPVRWEEKAVRRFSEPVRIAVARDEAFCFYYEDSLSLLREMGAEIVPFSPLNDAALPDGIDGLYLGGGYPEVHAERLSANGSMLASVRRALGEGLPCIAECGGFMYLTERIGDFPMAGVLPGGSFDTGRLCRFGYIELTAKRDNMLCRAGESIRAHEFHYWDSRDPGADFTAEKRSGKSWACVHATDRLYAGYPHFHFCANEAFAEGFYETCLKEKHSHDRKHQTDGY